MPKGVYPHKKASLETKQKMSLSSKHLAPWCKGLKLSDETRKRMSDSHKSNGSIPWCKGKKLSEETKEKMRISAKGKNAGSKQWNWKGGISPLSYAIRRSAKYLQWKKEVFERDNYTCRDCNIRNHKGLGITLKIHAHHIKEFYVLFQGFLKEYNNFSIVEDKETLLRLADNYKPFWDLDNGKTLCDDCHKITHFPLYIAEKLNG